jgi:hypothetical protein
MDRLNSMMLWLEAQEYQRAAELVHAGSKSISNPVYFLLSQSIELGLKAYLRGCGHSEDELRKIGHDLAKALKAAQKEALPVTLTEEEGAIIEALNTYYQPRLLQYTLTGSYRFPRPEASLALGSKIINGVKGFCDHRRSVHEGKPTAVE